MALVTTNGDAGDMLYTACVMKHIPGSPHSYLIEQNDELTATGKAEEGAQRLLEFSHDFIIQQPYIKECRLMQPSDAPYWRSGGFRKANLHDRDKPLMMAHLAHFRRVTGVDLKVDASQPWIHANPAPKSKGRVLINRTRRYHGKYFPWHEIVSFYGPRIAFVGLPYEHAEFCGEFGPVDFFPTDIMLQLAELIAGCELFIGNQSCAFALAEGMKINAIQETCRYIPDCIFKRENVQHVWNGSCILPSLDGGEDRIVPGPCLHIGLVSEGTTPPDLWQYPGMEPAMNFPLAVELASTLHTMQGKTRKEIGDAIKQYNLNLRPHHYAPMKDCDTVRNALLYAGYNL